MKVAITGATGLVGRHLAATLLSRNHSVVALTRDPSKAPRGTEGRTWNAKDAAALKAATAGCDAIVNLAGAGIFDRRWDEAYKEEIRGSRVAATKACAEACRDAAGPGVLVSGSAVGYYGPRTEEAVDEDGKGDPADFLGGVCAEWEAEARKAGEGGTRVVIVRTGIVLARDGGALDKMLPPFRIGFGGPVGRGDQYMSWIHIDDLCSMLTRAVEDPKWEGAFNGTAPKPVTNREFARALGRVLHRPAILPMPQLVLRMMLGEVASLVTKGQNVIPKRAMQHGFTFRHPEAEEALRSLLEVPETATHSS